jgi:hypothetical protein
MIGEGIDEGFEEAEHREDSRNDSADARLLKGDRRNGRDACGEPVKKRRR